MLVKTTVTEYQAGTEDEITTFMLDKGLAQNVTREGGGITGDFVDYSDGYSYLRLIQTLQKITGCRAVVEVSYS
jgi:hypothetical protein